LRLGTISARLRCARHSCCGMARLPARRLSAQFVARTTPCSQPGTLFCDRLLFPLAPKSRGESAIGGHSPALPSPLFGFLASAPTALRQALFTLLVTALARRTRRAFGHELKAIRFSLSLRCHQLCGVCLGLLRLRRGLVL
jgi:hypothetical protein